MTDLSAERQELQNASVQRAYTSFDATMRVVVIAKFPQGRWRTYTFVDPYRAVAALGAWQLFWDRKGNDCSSYEYLSRGQITDRISGYAASNVGCDTHTQECRLPKRVWVYVEGNVDLKRVSVQRLDARGKALHLPYPVNCFDVDRIRAPNDFPRSSWVHCGPHTWYFTYEPHGAEGLSVICPRNSEHGGISLYKPPLLAPVIIGTGVRPDDETHHENAEEMFYGIAQSCGLAVVDVNNMLH